MSPFVDATLLVLLVAMSGTVGISGLILTRSIQQGDAAAAWVWAGVFVRTSLLAALSFWRLVRGVIAWSFRAPGKTAALFSWTRAHPPYSASGAVFGPEAFGPEAEQARMRNTTPPMPY